jgi:hypothetical protein
VLISSMLLDVLLIWSDSAVAGTAILPIRDGEKGP